MIRVWIALAIVIAFLVLGGRPMAGPHARPPRVGGVARPYTEAASAAETPTLLVILVVDQMRFDYLDRYSAHWSGGLKRLATEGAVFERAFYPYLNTVTCAGHATIATGALPYAHGIIMNEWYRRTERRRLACTEEPTTVKSLPYTLRAEPVGHSAARLRVPTIGDRLRAASPTSRVVTLSMKPRSTVMLAGHGGTAVTWFGDSNVWATSTAYAPALLPEVKSFVEANPVERDRQEVWTHTRDVRDYTGHDQSPHERGRAGWTSTFPHPLAGAGIAPDRFFDFWERSPLSDTYLGRFASHLVREYKLGQRGVVDFLGVSFSALDYVGHDFGPESHEVQDTLFRLDRSLADLFATLDEVVGRDRYAVALSSDHGVARIPEAVRAEGGDAGRVLNSEVLKAAEAAMTAAHGKGPHVALVEYTNLYLTDEARMRASKEPTFVQPIVDAVSKVDGVLRVFPSRGLESKRGSTDPLERAAALSYHPDESGDVTIIIKPNWIGTSSSTTTHGSAQPYDQHVPVVFLGPTFKAGRYTTPASPADLAPTLASVVKLAMPNIDGKILRTP